MNVAYLLNFMDKKLKFTEIKSLVWLVLEGSLKPYSHCKAILFSLSSIPKSVSLVSVNHCVGPWQ